MQKGREETPSLEIFQENETLSINEQKIIRSILNGNTERYQELVQLHQNTIFTLMLRQVGKRDVAEELSQEVFIKAYINLSKFKFQASFLTWITRISLNHANSYFSSARYKRIAQTESLDLSKNDCEYICKNEEEKKEELLHIFRMAMAELKPKLREVLVLCALEGKTYEEVAGILGIPVGTVRSRLNTARRELKEIMKEFGESMQ